MANGYARPSDEQLLFNAIFNLIYSSLNDELGGSACFNLEHDREIVAEKYGIDLGKIKKEIAGEENDELD